MKYRSKLLIVFVILWIISAINPISMFDWFIENILVAGFITFLILTRNKKNFKLTNLSYTLIFFYLGLHLIGSHYSYSNVPIGFWFQDILSLARNPFDRIVHFLFGLLLAIPFKEILNQQQALGKKWKIAMIVMFVIALGAIYEVLEAFAALFLNPKQMIDFTGLQGDVWDAQKDIALAGLGAWIALVWNKKKNKKKKKK